MVFKIFFVLAFAHINLINGFYAKTSSKQMKRKQFQFMVFKNSEHFSNQKILNFFLAISLNLVSRIVSKYVKFNLPKNLILSKQSLDFVSGI